MESAKIDVLLEALGLKALPRAGWVRLGVASPESVASHSWGVAWLALVLCPAELDRGRALGYAVVHDLPEVRTGDITPHDGVAREDKTRREHEAMAALCAGLDAPALFALYEAYEAQADVESRFVKQLDRLDMALQALAQHEAGADGMAEFIEAAERFIDHPSLQPVMDAIREAIRRSARAG